MSSTPRMPLGPHDRFVCRRWSCELTVEACLRRQAERRDGVGAVRDRVSALPAFPECATCIQGREVAAAAGAPPAKGGAS